jgi:hypothetical protein
MKLLINYADASFRRSQQLNSETGMRVALFDKFVSYAPRNIDTDFLRKNSRILSQQRGSGFWLWKPYFIKKSLELIGDGDFLFYCDAGAYFIAPIDPLIDVAVQSGQDLIAFDVGFVEKIYTKRDAFILMDCDSPRYSESIQRLGGFCLWKKSEFTKHLVDEYLHYAQDERIITDIDNTLGRPNYEGFREHRHDQSIFSLLTKKYDLAAHRDPSQWGNEARALYPASNYGQLIDLTRARNGPVFESPNFSMTLTGRGA